jgi:hypothetical protein
MNLSTFNDGVHDTSLNATASLLKKLDNVFVDIEIRLAFSEQDTDYEFLLFKSRFDTAKVIKGIRSNAVFAKFLDNIKKSADFEIKFPLSPVSFWN